MSIHADPVWQWRRLMVKNNRGSKLEKDTLKVLTSFYGETGAKPKEEVEESEELLW